MPERKGHLAATPNDHLRAGSSGSRFATLIEGPIYPDRTYGEQMSREALQTYYERQLEGIRTYLGMTAAQRAPLMSVLDGFQADLSFLESRGIDVSAARSGFDQLNATK